MTVDIHEYDKAALLAALYNHAKPQGMGILHFEPRDMTVEEAQELLKGQSYFDYVKGRVMKIKLKEGQTTLDTSLYVRDNGERALSSALYEAI